MQKDIRSKARRHNKHWVDLFSFSLSKISYNHSHIKEIIMCMFCASIPVAAAVGAKVNTNQLSQPEEKRKPVGKFTGITIGLLMIASLVYHTLRWQG
jgi:hypothetical protein